MSKATIWAKNQPKFTLIWAEHTRNGSINRWARAETREEILRIIKHEGLETDPNAIIFLPDADDVSVSPAEMLSGLD